MRNPPTNMDDVIDSRDIIERIEELKALDSREITREEDEELSKLVSLAEECEGYANDWKYGEQLIRHSYFKDYAQELADDIGATNKDHGWPLNCIDWDEAADQLKQDYTEVDFDGVSYWIRCS